MKCQCITCQYILMRGQPKGRGACWKNVQAKPLDVMALRICRLWKLGAIQQVHARSTRRMVFNKEGTVRLI